VYFNITFEHQNMTRKQLLNRHYTLQFPPLLTKSVLPAAIILKYN